jgi:hypothetical protein
LREQAPSSATSSTAFSRQWAVLVRICQHLAELGGQHADLVRAASGDQLAELGGQRADLGRAAGNGRRATATSNTQRTTCAASNMVTSDARARSLAATGTSAGTRPSPFEGRAPVRSALLDRALGLNREASQVPVAVPARRRRADGGSSCGQAPSAVAAQPNTERRRAPSAGEPRVGHLSAERRVLQPRSPNAPLAPSRRLGEPCLSRALRRSSAAIARYGEPRGKPASSQVLNSVPPQRTQEADLLESHSTGHVRAAPAAEAAVAVSIAATTRARTAAASAATTTKTAQHSKVSLRC